MISACKCVTRCEYPWRTLLQPGQHLLAAAVSNHVPAHTAPAPAFLPHPMLPPAEVTITSGSYRAPASLIPETHTVGTCESLAAAPAAWQDDGPLCQGLSPSEGFRCASAQSL